MLTREHLHLVCCLGGFGLFCLGPFHCMPTCTCVRQCRQDSLMQLLPVDSFEALPVPLQRSHPHGGGACKVSLLEYRPCDNAA